ncbi:MAG: TonB-dependent receptor [Bacteroidetes bacterium]|nr:TonB-dependent receptor [Bacteroidota bacterium]
MKKNIFGAFLMFLMAIAVFDAQAREKTDAHITGHVVDATTHEHIPYATIIMEGTTYGTATDNTGHYLLKNLPVGRYIFEASMVGYYPQEVEITVQKDKTKELKFELKQQLIQMEQVVVTGSRTNANKLYSPTIVNVVDAKLFEATASSKVSQVLNFQPGLRVESTCSNCGSSSLRINGLGGAYSQLLLDSRPIFSALSGVYGLEQLPAAMIERVEVTRGGGSALFGSSAIGGVVNIITKQPQRNTVSLSNQTTILENGATDINTSINGSFVSDDNKAGVYIYGMVGDRDSYDRNNDGFSDIPESNNETIGFRGNYKLSKSSKLTAEYHHIKEYRRGGDNLSLPPHEAEIAETLTHKIDGGGLTYDFFTPDYRHKLSVYTSAQNVDRDSYYGAGKDPNAYGHTTDITVVAGAQYSYTFNKCLFLPAELTVGVEYTDDDLKDKQLSYDRHIDQHTNTAGFYFQNEWKHEKVNISIGARVDKHNLMKNVVLSPRLNVRYSPIKNIGIRASYSSGYRAPQAFDEDLHIGAVGGEVMLIDIDPNLRPEYSNSFSTSLDLYKDFGDNVSANLLVEGFYTMLDDVFTLVEAPDDAQGNHHQRRVNAEDGAKVYGVNFDLKLGITRKFSVDAGFTIQSSKYDTAIAHFDSVPAKRDFLRTPSDYGFLTLNYNVVKPLMLSLSGVYTGKMFIPHEATDFNLEKIIKSDEFFDLGFKVAYDFKLTNSIKLQLNAGVKNMFDSFQKDLDFGASKDAGYIYGPSAPRSYFFGVKFSI